jgi:outer membrane protein TolC
MTLEEQKAQHEKAVAALDKQIANLNASRATIKEELHDKWRSRDQHTEALSAINKALGMSEGERAAFAQVVAGAGGVESQEAVGQPGRRRQK